MVGMNGTIEASTTLPVDVASVAAIIGSDPGVVLCDTCSAEDRRARVFRTQIAAELHGGGRIGHEVELELGALDAEGGEFVLPLRWHASGHERLFPTFDGALRVRAGDKGTVLRLTGTYIVPLGLVGRFGDGLVRSRVVRGSLETFLADVVRRVDECVRNERAWSPGAAHFISVHDEVGPENYVG